MAQGPVEVQFGESWDQGASCKRAKYYSFQYKFRPQSATREGQGAVQIGQNTCTFWSGHDGDVSQAAQFQGQCGPVTKGQDCVAILENGAWRLELLQGMATNMRHVAGSGQSAVQPASSPKHAPTRSIPQAQSPEQVKRGLEEVANTQRASLAHEASMTPSLSPQPSTTTASQDISESPRPTSMTVGSHDEQAENARATIPLFSAPASTDNQPSPREIPSMPNSQVQPQLSASSESSISSSDSEAEVAQPQRHIPQKASAQAVQAQADMPDFEREFFQDNDSDNGSDSVSSDSEANDSEEEAKHF